MANFLEQYKALSAQLQRQFAELLRKTGFFTSAGSGGGMEIHGNEYHSPDFATLSDITGNVDGGVADSVYGGLTPVDGGGA